MIKVQGSAILKVDYTVVLEDMTTDEFDALPVKEQNELLDSHINWLDACRNAEVDDIEIYDIYEIKEGEN